MNGTLNLISKFKKLKNKQYRHAYLKEHIRVGIASQIRILRNKSNISQSQLAEIVGTKQSVISRLEDPDYGTVNLNTLLKIAEAFDVSLLVKFASFGKFINESQDISPKSLAVSNYTEESAYLKIQADIVISDITMSISPTPVNKGITPNWTKFSMANNQPLILITTQDELVSFTEAFPKERIEPEIYLRNNPSLWTTEKVNTIDQGTIFTQ